MSSPKHTPLLFRWRGAVLSKCGPTSSTTRLVLLALANHMNKMGGSCFPSTKRLAEETALSEKAICTHLDKAKEKGWIMVSTRGRTAGKAWAGHQYRATLPPNLNLEGTEQRSAPLGKAVEPHAKGTEHDSEKALNDVQSSSSVNSSKNFRDKEDLKKSKPPEGYFEDAKKLINSVHNES